MQKLLSIVLSLLIVLGLGPINNIGVVAQESDYYVDGDYSDEVASGYSEFSSYISSDVVESDGVMASSLDPSWFDNDSYSYNSNLAQLALKLAVASSNYLGEDRSRLDAYILNMYDTLGFSYINNYHTDFDYNDGDTIIYPDSTIENQPTTFSVDDISRDTIGYAIGYKNIKLSNNEDCTLIALTVRTSEDNEWADDFTMGTSGNHLGFDQSAKIVRTAITNYITGLRQGGCSSRIKILITGYSRGGAVSNILAHYLNNDMTTSGSSLYGQVRPEDVYTYGFAVPQGALASSVTNTGYSYGVNYGSSAVNYSVVLDNNIASIISTNDVVPKVAMSGMGFARYGKTYNLAGIKLTTDFYNSTIYQHMMEQYRSIAGGDVSIIQVHNQGPIYDNLTNRLVDLMTRDQYVGFCNAQKAARLLFNRLMTYEDTMTKVKITAYDSSGKVVKYGLFNASSLEKTIDLEDITGSITDILALYNQKDKLRSAAKDEIIITLKDSGGTTRSATIYLTGTQFGKVYDMADKLLGLYDIDVDNIMSLSSLTSILSNSEEYFGPLGDDLENLGKAIESVHLPNYTLALLSTYENGDDPLGSYTYRQIRYKGNASATVYYGGTALVTVGFATTKEMLEGINGGVEAYYDDATGEIVINLPCNDNYTVALANSSSQATQTVTSNLININTAQVLENYVFSFTNAKNTTYTLTPNKQTLTNVSPSTSNVYVDNLNVNFTVTNEGSEGDLVTYEKRQYRDHDVVHLSLTNTDDYTIEWKVDGKVISTANDLDYVVSKDHSALTYKLTESGYSITYHLDDGENDEGNPVSFKSSDGEIVLKDPSKAGYTFRGWYLEDTYINKVTSIVPSDYSSDIDLYAKFEYTPDEYVNSYVALSKTSLSIEDDLSLDVTVEVIDDSKYDDVTVSYQLGDGEEVSLGLDDLDNDDNLYSFSLVVGPKYYDDSISLVLAVGDIEATPITISFKDYFDELLNDNPENTTVLAARKYSTYVNNYFDGVSGVGLLNNEYEDVIDDYTYSMESYDGAKNVIGLKSVSLIVDGKLGLKFYVDVRDQSSLDSFDISVDKAGVDVYVGDDYFIVENISVGDINDYLDIRVSKNSVSMLKLSYSPMTYVNQVFRQSDAKYDNLKNLLLSLYEYGQVIDK